jgi:hypothetical protein
MKHNSSRMFLFQSLSRVEMEMIKQMSSLARHFSSHFSKQCKSSRPTPVGLRTRLGQRTPERMPPMTPEQQSQQQAAFAETATKVACVYYCRTTTPGRKAVVQIGTRRRFL